ncbi:C-type mannose receptor 2-like [Physella acuta]|uniref:C-type mannose receptor 2-like n=1 Tax=Physella acuta TaxID=109671 RepID=UPI0027DEA5C0|nr:C-type mannose receptor 2-like [Physella acuta]
MTIMDGVFLLLGTSLLIHYGVSITLDDCPASLLRDRYLQVHGDLCYEFIVYRQSTHLAAKSDCEINGGSLVFIKSAETQQYLTHQLEHTYKEHQSIWIGLDDIESENTFKWEDGTPLTYSHWAPGNGLTASGAHPAQHENKDCVAMDTRDGGKCKEFPCESTDILVIVSTNERHSYVCQYNPSAVVSQVTLPAGTTMSSITHTLPAGTTMSSITHTLPAGTTMSSITHPCPPLSCIDHCSVYKRDPVTGCFLCECEA